MMYDVNDTIVALSSPSGRSFNSIVRISGPETLEIIRGLFAPAPRQVERRIYRGTVSIDEDTKVAARLYLFIAPNTYTGDDLAELHILAGEPLLNRLIDSILARGARLAGPGEFTARAYLNSRIDLAQAEAVAQIVAATNRFQLSAAEKLLAGNLAKTTSRLCRELLELISRIEAGLDFATEQIEFIEQHEAIRRINQIRKQLQSLLDGSIHYEAIINIPSVAIAGPTNSGKSNLLNTLLGYERSIVSQERATTRDVLSGLLELPNSNCILFDCAGFVQEKKNLLEELAHVATMEAVKSANLVLFCTDITTEVSPEDAEILHAINNDRLICLATKQDLIQHQEDITRQLGKLQKMFGHNFTPVSALKGTGIENIKALLDCALVDLAGTSAESDSQIGLTLRHRDSVNQAIQNLNEAVPHIELKNDEVASLFLRAGYHALSLLERENIDDKILDLIFERFCIGK
ncbi:MAG: GTPase [Planctomycetota bacterium]